MFESIKMVGESLLSEGIVPFDIQRVKGKGTKLAKIIFDLDNGILDCDCGFECDKKRTEEFLWVGNAAGQKPQLVLTTDNPEYLLNARKKQKWAIGQIIEEVEERGLKDKDIEDLYEMLQDIKNNFFSKDENLVTSLEDILKKVNVDLKNIALYTTTLKKNGRTMDLVKEPGYRKFLNFVLYETKELVKGRCHICGEEKEVLIEPAYPEGTILCIYNIDKAGFLSGISRNPERLLKTHAICIDCKTKLRIGLRYIEQNLSTSIDGLNMFIIPNCFGIKTPSRLLDRFSKLKEVFGVPKSYKRLEEVEKEIEGYYEEFLGGSFVYTLNILFGRRVSSHFIYQHLIQNVPVTRLLEVRARFNKASKEFASSFVEEEDWWGLDFEGIYRIFPLRKSRTEVEWRPIVELFDAILTDKPYPAEEIIARAVLFARIHRYGTFGGFNIKPRERFADQEMCRGILKHLLLLKALKDIGVLEMEAQTLKEPLIPDEEIKDFLSLQGYNDWQSALFLLGVIVGKIGSEQYKKGDEKKSVLDKIGFEGTSVDRVKMLANYVLDGMRHYRILNSQNEMLYGCMKELLDRNIDKLKNPIENTFYLLSGYSYITKIITSGGK